MKHKNMLPFSQFQISLSIVTDAYNKHKLLSKPSKIALQISNQS